ncbi:MAG TPA: hypothetical protein VHK03_13345 [Aestuariivirgaceae bacterium]|nr:hypothetical protein [Aestuariivirgaceae bacterium]
MANQFRRPLKRRTATERLRLLQPTALQAAGGLTAVLLTAAMLWMALVSWPAPPSPVVRMALSAGDPVTTASADVAAVSDGHDREGTRVRAMRRRRTPSNRRWMRCRSTTCRPAPTMPMGEAPQTSR